MYHPGQKVSRPLAEYMKEMQMNNNFKECSEIKEIGFSSKFPIGIVEKFQNERT